MNHKNIAGFCIGVAFAVLGLLGAANDELAPSIAMVLVGLGFIVWHARRLVMAHRTAPEARE